MVDREMRGAASAPGPVEDCAAAAAPETLDRRREQIDAHSNQLAADLAAARSELAECRADAERLRARLTRFESEHYRVCDDYAVLEQQVAELGNICVVLERVHGTLDHGEVLAAIQDVVINVVGSEELAIFERSGDGFVPVQRFGLEARRLGEILARQDDVLGHAAVGEAWFVGDGPPPQEHADLTAAVPLTAGSTVVGVLAVWRMLGHKPRFGEADRAVLELLARHAGTALYLTSLQRPDAASRAA